jgi:predicted RNase H-like HicB family nuclease
MQLTAVIWPETLDTGETIYVSHCPELDIASQGDTIEEAEAMLQEAVEGFFEVADAAEIRRRLRVGAVIRSVRVDAPVLAA